jgi:serine-type D-Ala-D-Ala carboxypeptidase (penicillin-binding protein 5/6)
VRLLLALLGLAAAVPADRFPELASSYAVIVDDELRWGRELDTPRPPASLVKLLTAVELLSSDWQPDAVVEVSAQAAQADGTKLGLRAGERVRAGDLLDAMLVRSGNDACLALIEHAAGGVPAFASRLNRRAQALRMTRSVFVHGCGLDAPGQRTTVADLVPLAREAQRHGAILRAARTARLEIRTLDGRRLVLRNTNLLLDRVPGVFGLKTGRTQLAGDCLIALAERGEHRVMVLALGAPNRWWGTAAAIERAFRAAQPGPVD